MLHRGPSDRTLMQRAAFLPVHCRLCGTILTFAAAVDAARSRAAGRNAFGGMTRHQNRHLPLWKRAPCAPMQRFDPSTTWHSLLLIQSDLGMSHPRREEPRRKCRHPTPCQDLILSWPPPTESAVSRCCRPVNLLSPAQLLRRQRNHAMERSPDPGVSLSGA